MLIGTIWHAGSKYYREAGLNCFAVNISKCK